MGWIRGIIVCLMMGFAGSTLAETGLTIEIKAPRQIQQSSCRDCYWGRSPPEVRRAKRLACAESGDIGCQIYLALDYTYEPPNSPESGKDLVAARMWMERAAAAGSAEAAFWMSDAYSPKPYFKLGLSPSPEKQTQWAERAAERGHTSSLKRLVESYTQGIFTSVDDKRALYWLDHKTVATSYWYAADACKWLDEHNQWPRALPFCTRAVQRGSLDAPVRLGLALEAGKGGLKKDRSRAIAYYADAMPDERAATALKRLADKGDAEAYAIFRSFGGLKNPEAVADLAKTYETSDPMEAGRLYRYAASQGHVGAQGWMAAHPDITPDRLAAREVDATAISGRFTVRDPDSRRVEAYPFAEAIRRTVQRRGAIYYPPRAADAEIEGRTVVQCRWSQTGWLENCLVLEDKPKGYGFGAAALRVVAAPLTTQGNKDAATAYAGRTVTFTLLWTLE
ncbi:energy transducer TonB [Asticcacaulis sp. BYS171W]|uniref:Energy transducer TonB n=1 Tax=Asticcacaulis aquaticus TaxID=2984212 RepID=A0ABT5HQ44_9CAUL|nr:energy transducer TonB [Asticcacaulis aquaticus]MDC7682057.1 energy transducer TonB [Asticcacaulis aquaticus]